MDPHEARTIAYESHTYDRDRFGHLVIEHVERVAANVPEEARAIAFLHDVLEQTGTSVAELSARGLTSAEIAALKLLTRADSESYEAYALRIAWAPGRDGYLARCVKIADLDDHLSHETMPSGAPPYGWARRHISFGQERQQQGRQAA
jgi:hypothetical protein